MFGRLLFIFKIQRIFFLCTIILSLVFFYSPQNYAQNEGVSLHGDFISGVFSHGFDKSIPHPGNFLIGGQYNYPLSSMVEINGGLDLLFVDLYGNLDGINHQVEVFLPFIFGGIALNFDDWRIFGKIGVSLDESIYPIGTGKGWASSILNFYMGSFQFGIKVPLNNSLALSTSIGTYFGKQIKIDNTLVSFTTINLGLSYNLFSPEILPQPPVVEKGVEDYKDRDSALQSENKDLHKQIGDLHERIKVLESNAVVKNEPVLLPVPVLTPVKSISVDSINNVYNLHFRQPLNQRDFVNKKGLKEEGRLILNEYNHIAATFKGLQSGIYLICTVADAKVFKKNASDFPRIKFQADPSVRNKLVIDIDIKATESNNKIKLNIK